LIAWDTLRKEVAEVVVVLVGQRAEEDAAKLEVGGVIEAVLVFVWQGKKLAVEKLLFGGY